MNELCTSTNCRSISCILSNCKIPLTPTSKSEEDTGFRLCGLRIYGLLGFISVIWSMVNQILVVNFSDIWSFRLYGQLYQDKTVDHISETRCTFSLSWGGLRKLHERCNVTLWNQNTAGLPPSCSFAPTQQFFCCELVRHSAVAIRNSAQKHNGTKYTNWDSLANYWLADM